MSSSKRSELGKNAKGARTSTLSIFPWNFLSVPCKRPAIVANFPKFALDSFRGGGLVLPEFGALVETPHSEEGLRPCTGRG